MRIAIITSKQMWLGRRQGTKSEVARKLLGNFGRIFSIGRRPTREALEGWKGVGGSTLLLPLPLQ